MLISFMFLYSCYFIILVFSDSFHVIITFWLIHAKTSQRRDRKVKKVEIPKDSYISGFFSYLISVSLVDLILGMMQESMREKIPRERDSKRKRIHDQRVFSLDSFYLLGYSMHFS
jgi:hypothetical protein